MAGSPRAKRERSKEGESVDAGRPYARRPFRPERYTVLIVDDDPAVIYTFVRMLRLEGYRVLTALDAETGLREFETGKPDAVLLDLRMPAVDGLAFLRSLRAQDSERRTPVAIITGDYFPDEALRQELSELGAILYFKPVWVEDLIGIMQRLLASNP
jgi:two-component system response regulator PrrA